eukprot:jgi/Chlat1/4247/Chrsp27S04324
MQTLERSSINAQEEDLVTDRQMTSEVKIVAVASHEQSVFGVSWLEVFHHMASRLRNINPAFHLEVLDSTQIVDQTNNVVNKSEQLFLAVGMRDIDATSAISSLSSASTTAVFLGCTPELEAKTRLGGNVVSNFDSPLSAISEKLPWNGDLAKSKLLSRAISEAWRRCTFDDLVFIVLVMINAYVTEVKQVQNMRATDLSMLQCMITNCGSQILACMLDPNCRQGLDCLNACAPNDQVWRGKELTHTLAEEIFVGWRNSGKQWSWRAVAGQNAAYDHFNNQYQLYYYGKSTTAFWYDPVFQVETLDGRKVWRRRHYRVKRGDKPGTFFFTVLDNGVTSREFWRIVDAPDDLSWSLCFYSGAAKAAGLAYTGAVLLTPDGLWPGAEHKDRLDAALDLCGIKAWELCRVKNTDTDVPAELLEVPVYT